MPNALESRKGHVDRRKLAYMRWPPSLRLRGRKTHFVKQESSDIGCHPGDPQNSILPWARSEELPTIPRRWNESLYPWQITPQGRCGIIVDRHVHKNGGSSIRDMFLENERMGYGLYQGYTQLYWQKDFKQVRKVVDAALEKGQVRAIVSNPLARF